MKNPNRCRISILMLCVLFAQGAYGQNGDSGNVRTSIAPVKNFAQTVVIPYAGASLMRHNDGVFANFSTSQLTPDTVVSLWWVIFNNPNSCPFTGCRVQDLFNPSVNASLHNAGARIVGRDGTAMFGSYLGLSDLTGSHILPGMPDPSPGLVDPKGATIHLVVRSHGPASMDPAILAQQLALFNGGCPPGGCVNIQAAVFEP